jgi:hypothetical protein
MKIKKSLEVLFYPISQTASEFIDPPQPASKTNIPESFRKVPKYLNGQTEFLNFGGNSNNLTVKSCLPIVDSLTSGYTICTPYDIQIQRMGDGYVQPTFAASEPGLSPFLTRRTDMKTDVHHFKNLYGYDAVEFNWVPQWCIKTPKGYSCLFVPPLNNSDDRFSVIPGIVDTDSYINEINFPIVINGDKYPVLETTIKKGTHYVQIIPFKRDSWKMTLRPRLQKEIQNSRLFYGLKILNIYKDKYWNKKSWK